MKNFIIVIIIITTFLCTIPIINILCCILYLHPRYGRMKSMQDETQKTVISHHER